MIGDIWQGSKWPKVLKKKNKIRKKLEVLLGPALPCGHVSTRPVLDAENN